MMLRQVQLRWSTDSGASIVTLRGDVDAGAAWDLRAIGDVADDVPALTVDLSEVSFVDIVGLDLLEELASRPNVELRNPTPSMIRLLRRTEPLIDDWRSLRHGLSAAQQGV